MTNCIEISGLNKSFDGFALRDISLNLPGGTILGLIGENGAGKTTTIKCILNQLRWDSGTIKVLGREVRREEKLVKQEVGVVLDECFFHASLRPADLSRIFAPIYEHWDDGLYREYLDKFSLPPKKLIKEFSRGMKMKLSLAAALAHRPRLLILDEATAGLDPVVRDEILGEFLDFIQDEDHAILMSSHITTDLEKVADYIAYIHQGQVVLQGRKDDILETYGRVGLSREHLEKVDSADLFRVKKGSFGTQALVCDRAAFVRKYPDIPVDRVGLEDIMLFVGRGEEK